MRTLTVLHRRLADGLEVGVPIENAVRQKRVVVLDGA